MLFFIFSVYKSIKYLDKRKDVVRFRIHVSLLRWLDYIGFFGFFNHFSVKISGSFHERDAFNVCNSPQNQDNSIFIVPQNQYILKMAASSLYCIAALMIKLIIEAAVSVRIVLHSVSCSLSEFEALLDIRRLPCISINAESDAEFVCELFRCKHIAQESVDQLLIVILMRAV